KESLNLLLNNPTMHRESIYFQDKNMRDMVHRGYTVVYRIRPIKKEIEILRIFNKNKPTQ
ncbi:MAG TPA: type II toxin-antitoxin system RelE/ParE family toxin, partial [Sulfurovum sp.]|nr:type II toxin-antitoxin system RelE/ParE family toxin [Sulfurovum sp.]